MRHPHLSARLHGFGTTIFAEMSQLAADTGAVNLGQGFPDFDGPSTVADAAVAAIRDGHNQYAPGRGVPTLRHAIAEHQQRFRGLSLDPETEIVVTAGATEAICAALQGLCDTGDEVVAFEPFYDSYQASAAMAGAWLRPVPLRVEDGRFTFSDADLRAAVSDRTRLILLNSPHNPTGKVFTREELQRIADVAIANDLVVVTDEVYEHLVFAPHEHISIATLNGMRERTLVISSGGKTFSFTGWKIGWCHGPEQLVDAVLTAKQFMTYVNGTPFQHAIATALRLPDDYFSGFRDDFAARRDRLCDGLAAAGFAVVKPEGTYFATVDIRVFGDIDGLALCRALPGLVGVAAIPEQVFFADPRDGRHLVRFAFCKTDEVLDEGVRRLAAGRDAIRRWSGS